jgi:hypothetical protein
MVFAVKRLKCNISLEGIFLSMLGVEFMEFVFLTSMGNKGGIIVSLFSPVVIVFLTSR